jgi:hypothetical protein
MQAAAVGCMYNARRRSKTGNIINWVKVKAGEKRGNQQHGVTSRVVRVRASTTLALCSPYVPYLTVSVSCRRRPCHWMGPETYIAVLYKDDIRAQPGIQRRKCLRLRGWSSASPENYSRNRTQLGLGSRLQCVTGTAPKTHDKAGSPPGTFGNTDHASQPSPPLVVGSSGTL